MRNIHKTPLILTLFTLTLHGQNQNKVPEKYQILPFGSIKPTGWLKTQMQKDVDGFVGNLDKLELNKICLTDVNVQEDLYASEHRKIIEENVKEKFKNKNSAKIKKYIDQSSSIFANELYKGNLNSKDFFNFFFNFF